MATKITRDILESYLHCKFKGHLKFTSQQGIKCDYENLLTAMRAKVRLAAIDKILAPHAGEDIPRNIPITTSALKEGASFLLDATLEDDFVSLNFDGLKKADGPSKLGDFHYIPMLFIEGEKVPKEERSLLEVYGLLLSRLQGQMPVHGIIWHGKECKATRVRLNADLRKTEGLLERIRQAQETEIPPRLILNEHCQICEYRQRCHQEATEADSLSLLRGISENEIAGLNKKGIFSVTQLSYTFRARKKRKRAKSPSNPHYYSLQALALRDKKVYVHGAPSIPCPTLGIYFDIEGSLDRDSYYLIGLIVVDNEGVRQHSFWANSEKEQEAIFGSFIDTVMQHRECPLFHFGSYEATALRQMRYCLRRKHQMALDAILKRLVNILAVIHPYIYFPTYSNGLKEIGLHLGFNWTECEASGIQSLVWRARWEASQDPQLKARLLQYNLDDCMALRTVVEFISIVTSTKESCADEPGKRPGVAYTRDLQGHRPREKMFGNKDYALPDLECINKCGYFDYQRDRVFARTNRHVKTIEKRRARKLRRFPRPNRTIVITCKCCPYCKKQEIKSIQLLSRYLVDLKFFKGGVKKWIIKYASWRYRCLNCDKLFSSRRLQEATVCYGHGLISWTVYHNVGCGQNLLQVKKGLLEVFDFNFFFPRNQLYRFKASVSKYYQTTYKQILPSILSGHIIHIDETEVALRGKKGYVWVVANFEAVYFFYKDSREGAFLEAMLEGFSGVLISDFFSAYDSLKCSQQKCLVHLLRDLNEDLLRNPFDEQFKNLTQRFAALLRTITETIDRYGLKKKHLHKHQVDVQRFFSWLYSMDFSSDVAIKLQTRLRKNEAKLFIFLDHDGVPWNNTNAEHAIKSFARYRRFADGRFTEATIKDYLMMLSVYQTCEYQGVRFLDFLLSKQKDIGAFAEFVRQGGRVIH